MSRCCSSAPGFAQDIKDAVEPPIVGRYVREQSVRAFDRTEMATQFDARGSFGRIKVEGRRTLPDLQGPRGMLFEGLGPDVTSEFRRPLAKYGDGSIEDQHYLVASRTCLRELSTSGQRRWGRPCRL